MKLTFSKIFLVLSIFFLYSAVHAVDKVKKVGNTTPSAESPAPDSPAKMEAGEKVNGAGLEGAAKKTTPGVESEKEKEFLNTSESSDFEDIEVEE